MPRKHPMPVRERLICRRLREFRISLGLNMEQFCKSAGLARTAYASYEYAASQLNYSAAWRILNAWPELNPQWLAGEDYVPMRDLWFVDYPAPEEVGAGPRAAFSLVYEWHLKRMLLLSRSGILVDGKMPIFRVSRDAGGRVIGREKFARIIGEWIAQQPDSKFIEFLDALLQRGSGLLKEFPRDKDNEAINQRRTEMHAFEAKRRFALLNQGLSTAENSKKRLLTEITPERNVSGMTEIALLLQRLKRALVGVKKGDLARSLKVPLPRVSEWLSGRVMPSGETALRLLEWVKKREESLQETPGSATNVAKGKTQVRSYEKAKSGPIKR